MDIEEKKEEGKDNMVRVILDAGQRLRVQLADAGGDLTDGEFIVDHGASEHNRLTVSADLPGNRVPDLEKRAKAAFEAWDNAYQPGMDSWESIFESDREHWRSIVKAAFNASFSEGGVLVPALIYAEEWDNSFSTDIKPVAPHPSTHGSFGGGPDKD